MSEHQHLFPQTEMNACLFINTNSWCSRTIFSRQSRGQTYSYKLPSLQHQNLVFICTNSWCLSTIFSRQNKGKVTATNFHPFKAKTWRETYFLFLNLVITSKILEKKSCSTLSVLMQLSLHTVVLWFTVFNMCEDYSNKIKNSIWQLQGINLQD